MWRTFALAGLTVSRRGEGSGNGTWIGRVIVERHGGQVTASSDGKSGTIFQFTLPIKTTDERPEQDLIFAILS
jgi:signal transduction histidine kinase